MMKEPETLSDHPAAGVFQPAEPGGSRTILIHTIDGDFHAAVVGHALRGRGNRVMEWRGNDVPLASSSTLRFAEGRLHGVLHTRDGNISSDDVEVVWHRRRRILSAPSYVDPLDEEFATEELRMSERSHPEAFATAFWVNPHVSSLLCESKARQLRYAQDAGLYIPSTLISNDPDDIRQFLSSDRAYIYKPLGGHVWDEEGVVRKTYTAGVTTEDLPSDRILRATPGIFQEKIEKSYEVRAQFFGTSCFAIRIESSQLQSGDIDWRLDQRSIERCEPALMPEEVKQACIALMTRLRIVSGGFDFIVTPDEKWCFMEVNDAGQFLFIESWCPDLPLLDAFCQFLEHGKANFAYCPPQTALSLKQVTISAHEHGLISK